MTEQVSPGGPPRVFVSSTVFDFHDLRSALRYWLRELGYDPQLSDYSDFDKPLDQNSYDACLRTVESSDYFVLLIGARVGGFYDKHERISITRQEYRCAYESFQRTGRPRIIAFVRADVWAVREDRKGLQQHLRGLVGNGRAKNKSQSTSTKILDSLKKRLLGTKVEDIVNHESRIVENAEAIFGFLDEVSRKDEMQAAVAQGKGFPTGNWIHTFGGFDDIVAVLQNELSTRSIARAAIEANLQASLTVIVEILTSPFGEYRTANSSEVRALRPRLGDEFDASVEATGKELAHAAAFWMLNKALGATINTSAIDEAIRSGHFLRWNAEAHAFEPTSLHQALGLLRDEIEHLRRMASYRNEEFQKVVAGWSHGWRSRAAATMSVQRDLLLPICALHDRHANVLDLVAGIHAGLAGDESVLDAVELWSSTPSTAHRAPMHTDSGRRLRLEAWLLGRASDIKRAREE